MANLGAMKSDTTLQYAHYSKTAASEDVGGTTPTPIGWDTEDHEDSNFTHDTVTNNSRVTVGMTSRYAIKATVTVDNTVANKFWGGSCYLRVNGTTDKKAGIDRTMSRDGSGEEYCTFNIVTELDLAMNDYIEVMVAQEFEDAVGDPVVNTINGECELIIRCIE